MFLIVKSFTPISCLFKAAGFAIGCSCTLFVGAGLLEYVKLRKPSIFRYLKYLSPNELFSVDTRLNAYNRLSRGHRCTLAIIGINICVCLAWTVKYFHKAMNNLFICRFSSDDIHWPVLLSSFSHQDIFYLALNMSLLGDSAPLIINGLLSVNEFCCFYLAAGMFGSVASLAGSLYKGHYKMGSMGAACIVSATFVYRLMKQPEAQIRFFGLPVDARIYVVLYLLFDFTCLLYSANTRVDCAALLGGSLFGIFYAACGEHLYRKLFPAGRRFGDV